MSGFFVFLFLISLVALVIGLIKPSLIKIKSRKQAGYILGSTAFVLLLIVGFTAPPVPKTDNPTSTAEQVAGTAQESSSSAITDDAQMQNNVLVADSNSGSNTPQANSPSASAQTVSTPSPTQTVAPSQSSLVPVTDVVDGDTLKVSLNGETQTIRLIGIDTPETVDPRKPVQCFGKQASDKAKATLAGQKVRLESDPSQGDVDKYGRLLRYVYLSDGTFFNEMMVAQGYAHEYTYDTPYKYQAEFKADQAAAEKAQLGLWSPSTCDGNTTQAAASSSNSSSGSTVSAAYYTSSYSTSKYWYPASCSGWQGLDSKYLKSFATLNALLAAYPSRTESPSCQ
jgi:endonuclease YncB( thermonuclease family)